MIRVLRNGLASNKPPLKNRDLFNYLDVNGNQKIKRDDFMEMIRRTGFDGLGDTEMESVFSFLDHNNNGFVSLNEFRYYFYEREFLEKEVKESAFTSALEDELKTLFDKLDEDKSGTIEIEEFVNCLNLLGYIVTPESVEYEFRK